MKILLLTFFIILTFNGCFYKTLEEKYLKSDLDIYSYNNFNYSKKQIDYFENEFENILAINNPAILKTYLEFYEKNASYFINGKQKVQMLKEKISSYSTSDKTLQKLEEAKNAEIEESIIIYKELAKQGNIKAKRELVEHYKITKPEYALKVLKELVELEDIKSMKDYASANIFMIRPVREQNLQKALEVYEKLAKKGELSSIMRLGNFYEYGYHKSVIPQDKKLALEYYEEAALKNYLPAVKKLFEIYSCKTCTPNRYNEKRAKELQEVLQKDFDKKLIKVLSKGN